MTRVELVLIDVLPAPDSGAVTLLRYEQLVLRSARNRSLVTARDGAGTHHLVG